MRLLIFFVLAYLSFRLLRGLIKTGRPPNTTKEGGMIDEMVQDPFCKTYVSKNSTHREFIGGRELFFCSKECAEKYKKEMQQ